MRKRVLSILATCILAAGIAACATPPTGTVGSPTQVPPAATFNDKEALGLRTITLIRTSATTLMTANKLTVDQDALIQAQLNLAVSGLRIARSMQTDHPDEAAAQITATLAGIEALKTQTGVK